MTFKIGDTVKIVDNWPSQDIRNKYAESRSTAFGTTDLRITEVCSDTTYKLDKLTNKFSYWSADLLEPCTILPEHPATLEVIPELATLVTLSDGTRIYHPTNGTPIELTSKGNL